MIEPYGRQIWGILGGMGPLASAEFLSTIYHYSEYTNEQDAPRVVLFSDPTIRDRTESFLRGEEEELLRQLIAYLGRLRNAGATRIIVCCFTMHHLFSRLSVAETQDVVSLVEVALQAVIAGRRKHLLLCTRGSMQLRIFQQHPLWLAASSRVIVPNKTDWQPIHDLIYAVKQQIITEREVNILTRLLRSYEVESFIAGCTELHVLARQLQDRDGWHPLCIDPLDLLARQISNSTALLHKSVSSL
jgi:aspartate racemase